MAAPIFELKHLQFGWDSTQPVLLDIEQLHLPTGAHLMIQGVSGSGKSTLLNLLSGVLTPSKGEVHVCGRSLNRLSANQRDRFRADHLGIIFQQFNLLPFLSPIENCLLALTFSRRRRKNCPQPRTTAVDLLKQLNLPEALLHQPASQLSTGQQQRVAIARALMGQPDLIIADEPTSALDVGHRDRFMQCLFDSAELYGASIVLVSHDPTLATYFQHHVTLPAPNAPQDGGNP